MIDFACKQFNLDDILKCGLGLTKAELKILKYFLDNSSENQTTEKIAKKLKLNLTTVQKGVKKLSDQKIINKKQKNLHGGGYVYLYKCNTKKEVREIIKKIIRSWSDKVEEKINKW